MKNFFRKFCLLLTVAIVAGCSGQEPTSSGPSAATAASEDSGGTKISTEAAQRAGIEIAVAGPAGIRETLTLYGSIKANAEREQDIRARYAGVVRSVTKRAGDNVKKGEILLTVESSESLQVYPIAAPLGGQVLDRNTNPGDAVDISTTLMKVADLSSVWIEFAIFSRDLAHVRRDMTVLFNNSDADEGGKAKLSYVAPAGHPDSQSVVARAVVDNSQGKWIPGQFVTGEVVVADATVPIAVVPSALQVMDGKTVVFVQTARGFEPHEVKVGRRSRDAVEIITGLVAGDHYAAKNSYLIKADLLKGEAEEE